MCNMLRVLCNIFSLTLMGSNFDPLTSLHNKMALVSKLFSLAIISHQALTP